MSLKALSSYIQQCRRLKIPDEVITQQLLSADWPIDLIKKALAGRNILINIKDLAKEYKLTKELKAPALRKIDLDIYKGEFLSITGHSGSGKTTLLNLIGLLDEPSAGKILINNENIHKLKESKRVAFRLKFVSFIFQFYNLIDNYTALENIAFPLRLQGYSRKESKNKAQEIIEFLGLKQRADFYPYKLSGGEQQRVAVGRALAKDSMVILADEPTAHLDTKNGQNIISLLRDINSKFNRTIILVSHELEYAQQADRMIVLKDGQIINAGFGTNTTN